jgi:hypothetical protein
MVRSLLVAALMLAAIPAQAQRGRQYEDWDTGDRLRVGAGCVLEVYGLRRPGRCNVLRRGDSTNTFVQVGDVVYLIKRDGLGSVSKRSASFYRVTPEGQDNQFITNVEARGSCWVGDGVRFCAR